MKKVLLLVVSILLAHYSFSQAISGHIEDHDRVKPDSMYMGLYNKYKLVIENCPCKHVFLKGEKAEIIKEKDCVFYIRPLADTIISMDVYKGRHKVNFVIVFETTNSIPLPSLRITKKLTEGGAIVGLPDSIYVLPPLSGQYNSSLKYKVISYTIEILKKEKNGKVLYSEFIVGDTLTQKTKTALREATPREYIHLKDVSILMPNDKQYIIKDSWFYIGM